MIASKLFQIIKHEGAPPIIGRHKDNNTNIDKLSDINNNHLQYSQERRTPHIHATDKLATNFSCRQLAHQFTALN